MFHRHLIRLASACLLLAAARSWAAEDNVWPVYVRQAAPPGVKAQAIGPLLFEEAAPGVDHRGMRPIYLETNTPGGQESSFLYPFFTWRREEDFRSFSFFQLVNFRSDEGIGPGLDRRFDVWPIWFSRENGDPEESYRALFPLGGTIKHRFGRDRIRFVTFPLYARTEKDERQTTHAPWPFLRFTGGEGYRGFEFWPLFGHVAHEGESDLRYWVWPFFYRSAKKLSDAQPELKIGAIPFYTRDTGPGYINENYAWPFFGYSDRTEPYEYHETRWFWPLLVQGRGEARYVNRWAPVYTHSIIKGSEKTWLLWPLFRRQSWQADGLEQEKTQLLFFVFWSLEQHRPGQPAPAARKTHLWPLYSAWDNGAGRQQVQALSPFEVFFPRNETIRRLWTPLFALYRYERQPDRRERHALLWNAVTWRRGPDSREFHLGPIASYEADGQERRFALGHGLVGMRRRPGGGWRPFLFDFSPRSAMKETDAPSP